jgi:hypothetical protein
MVERLLDNTWDKKHFETLADFLNKKPFQLKKEIQYLKDKISIVDFIYSQILTPSVIDFLSKKGNTKNIILSTGFIIKPEIILDVSKKMAIYGYVNYSNYPLLNSILIHLASVNIEDVIARCLTCRSLLYRSRANKLFCSKICRNRKYYQDRLNS